MTINPKLFLPDVIHNGSREIEKYHELVAPVESTQFLGSSEPKQTCADIVFFLRDISFNKPLEFQASYIDFDLCGLIIDKSLFVRVDTQYAMTSYRNAWWRHQMDTFSALLAICAGNSPVPGEFPAQRPVTRSFDVFFDLHPNKRLSKQWWGWWFETPPCPLRRHRNGFMTHFYHIRIYHHVGDVPCHQPFQFHSSFTTHFTAVLRHI